MNVKKEVFEKCKAMVERELTKARDALHTNKNSINKLAQEQHVLKAQVVKLHAMLRSLTETEPKK